MGAIASAAIAAKVRNNNQNYVTSSWLYKEKASLISKASLNTNWLKECSPLLLPHVNEPLLKNIYSQINNTSKEKLNEPELKKTYLTLIHSLSIYQTEAEDIFLKRDNLKSRALFLAIVFALPLFICICVSISSPFMLPVMALSLLFCVSFVGIPLYSAYKLREKHPTNESKLNTHFKNFTHIFEKYIDNKPDNFKTNTPFQPYEPIPSHNNKPEANINAKNLKNKTSFFKFSDSAEEYPAVIEQEHKPIKLPQPL